MGNDFLALLGIFGVSLLFDTDISLSLSLSADHFKRHVKVSCNDRWQPFRYGQGRRKYPMSAYLSNSISHVRMDPSYGSFRCPSSRRCLSPVAIFMGRRMTEHNMSPANGYRYGYRLFGVRFSYQRTLISGHTYKNQWCVDAT
ncbi:Hypothetical protein NTJ_15088 [Nesidiocoris tenuis]|uniref:Secreted protein n=1 Tax=Nesidiocoris tenuis TaxID=355587 RepID=A0ABN7BD18_9HEMI|nr:Hypothetical protein NTJ_15088 [Nesidiocoris tenuis]